jgi:hypothetical protein
MIIAEAISRAATARDDITQRINTATEALVALTTERDRLEAALSTISSVPADHMAVLDAYLTPPSAAPAE